MLKELVSYLVASMLKSIILVSGKHVEGVLAPLSRLVTGILKEHLLRLVASMVKEYLFQYPG